MSGNLQENVGVRWPRFASSPPHGDRIEPSQRRQRAEAVLIVDGQECFAEPLATSFRGLGFSARVTANFEQARQACSSEHAGLIVSELRVDGEWVFDFVTLLQNRQCAARIVIATAYPSIATAVRATKSGLAGYVVKPVNAHTILAICEARLPELDDEDALQWPSLDRTIWEYLNQVLVVSGSMSAAARRLGIDRRSLRRMLAKHPPAR